MYAFHILLGTPWKFDKKEVHEGKMIVCSFEVNGTRHNSHRLRGKKHEVNVSNQLLMLNDN